MTHHLFMGTEDYTYIQHVYIPNYLLRVRVVGIKVNHICSISTMDGYLYIKYNNSIH